jgi:hypothetical protein
MLLRHVFQDPESYLNKGSFVRLSKKTNRDVLAADELQVLSMFSFNGLIEALAGLEPKTLREKQ